jgi:hypothetical protein
MVAESFVGAGLGMGIGGGVGTVGSEEHATPMESTNASRGTSSVLIGIKFPAAINTDDEPGNNLDAKKY